MAYIQKCIDAETILGMELAPPNPTVLTNQSDERLAALEAQVAALSAKFESAIATPKDERESFELDTLLSAKLESAIAN